MNMITTGTHVRGLIAAGILGILASGIAAADAAAQDIESVSTIVKYGDLNMTRPEGATALYGRIVAAAHDICDVYVNVSARAQALAKTCVHNAVVDAVMKVNRPQVFAVYNARNREPLPITLAADQKR